MKSVGLSSSECSRETVRAVHTGMQFYMPVSVSCLLSPCDLHRRM